MGDEIKAIDGPDSIQDLLDDARAAYDADESDVVNALCAEVFKLDPENLDAWILAAKMSAWDSKLYTLDYDSAMAAIRRALELAPESRRHEIASEIYSARKKQIAYKMEADMMMPSWTGAKRFQETMELWLAFLKNTPYLTSEILNAEITLCDNLCLRSKLSFMPGDRLPYTAYMSINDKVPYGDMFREALAPRLQAEAEADAERTKQALDDSLRIIGEYPARLADACLTPEGKKALASELLGELKANADAIAGVSNRGVYQAELDEVRSRRAALKPAKIFKKKQLDERIQSLEAKLAQIDGELEEALAPIRRAIAELEQLA